MSQYSEYMSDEFKDVILARYLLQCRSQRTRTEYIGYVRLLCDYLKKDFLEIEIEDAERVFDYWTSKQLARRTIRTRLSCFNSIVRFMKEDIEGYEGFVNPFEFIIRPDISDEIRPQNIPTLEELDKIMSQAKKEGLMWYLILALVSRACLSPSKITQITKDSIYKEDGKVGLYFKDKSAIVLPSDIAPIMESYLSTVFLNDSQGHIFYNKHSRALTIKNLDTKVSNIIEKSGVGQKYTLINIRARAILELAKAGADEDTISHYADLGAMRTRQFVEAKSLIGDCPADLVNYRLCETAV